MTSIRAQLDSHTPILAARSDNEGFVLVEHADFRELAEIAEEPEGSVVRVRSTTATHVEVAASYFDQLVNRAHAKLHGDGLLNALFGDPENLFPSAVYGGEKPETEDQQPEQQTIEDANYRSTAMHYAVQLVDTQIQSAHGLDTPAPASVVDVAAAILGFLKG